MGYRYSFLTVLFPDNDISMAVIGQDHNHSRPELNDIHPHACLGNNN